MKSGFLALLTVIILTTSCMAETAEENPALGKILSVENTVRVLRQTASENIPEEGEEQVSEEITAKPGMPLFAGDTLSSGEDSRVSFTLYPDSSFDLGESTEVSIDELSDTDEESEARPLLRLVTGFLRSAIRNISGDSRPAVQTPTAVAGIRGTEFDTVVALDGTTALSVKEGSVHLDWESGKTLIPTGRMIEVDEETEKAETLAAVPKKNWNTWIAEKEKDFPEKLRRKIPRLRRRFEKAEETHAHHHSKIREAHLRVSKAMEAVHRAEESGDAEALELAHRSFEQERVRLKQNMSESRIFLNKMETAGRQWAKIRKYVKKNKKRFPQEDLLQIQSHAKYVKEKHKSLKKKFKQSRRELKRMGKKVKKFKKDRKHKKDKRKKDKDKKDKKGKDKKHKDKHEKGGHKKDKKNKEGKDDKDD